MSIAKRTLWLSLPLLIIVTPSLLACLLWASSYMLHATKKKVARHYTCKGKKGSKFYSNTFFKLCFKAKQRRHQRLHRRKLQVRFSFRNLHICTYNSLSSNLWNPIRRKFYEICIWNSRIASYSITIMYIFCHFCSQCHNVN